jgi:translocation and assembly module TamB
LKKRIVALAFLAVVVALVAATFVVLRTRWAGERICALLAARAEAAAGLPLAFRACRILPLTLEEEADGVRLGPPGAPVFTAERVAARLVTIQALGGRVRIASIHLDRPRLVAAVPARARGARAAARRTSSPASRCAIWRSPTARSTSVPGRDPPRGGPPRRPHALGPAAHAPRPRAAADALEVAAEDVRLTGVDDRPFTSPHATVAADVALDLSSAEVAGVDALVDGVRFAGKGACATCARRARPRGARERAAARGARPRARAQDAPAAGTVSGELHVGGRAAAPDRRNASLRGHPRRLVPPGAGARR